MQDILGEKSTSFRHLVCRLYDLALVVDGAAVDKIDVLELASKKTFSFMVSLITQKSLQKCTLSGQVLVPFPLQAFVMFEPLNPCNVTYKVSFF